MAVPGPVRVSSSFSSLVSMVSALPWRRIPRSGRGLGAPLAGRLEVHFIASRHRHPPREDRALALTATVYHVDLSRGTIETKTLPEDVYRKYPGRQRARRIPSAAVDSRRRRSARPRQRAGHGGEPAHRARHLGPEPHDGLRPLAAHRRHRRQPVRRLLPRRDARGRRRRLRLHRPVEGARVPLAQRRPGRAPARQASLGQGHRRGGLACSRRRSATRRWRWRRSAPPGENLVRFAAIMNMVNRANGRTGLGAVMGSKRLKAVVVRGSKSPKPAMPEEFRGLVKRLKELQEANPGIVWFGEYGTAGVLAIQDKMGGQPTRNYTEGTFEHARTSTARRSSRRSSRSATPATPAWSSASAWSRSTSPASTWTPSTAGPSTRR